MKPENNGERIIALETNMTNIAKDISDIKADIKGIVMQLNQQISKQPTLEAEIIALKTELFNIREEIVSVKKTSNLWKWLAPTLTAILTATVTFLLIQYIQKI